MAIDHSFMEEVKVLTPPLKGSEKMTRKLSVLIIIYIVGIGHLLGDARKLKESRYLERKREREREEERESISERYY